MNKTVLGISVLGLYLATLLAYAFNNRAKEENRVPLEMLQFSLINSIIGSISYFAL